MQTNVTMLTPAADAGDITLTGGGNLTITSVGLIPLKKAVLSAKVAAAAAVASQATVVVGSAGAVSNSTTYSFGISQMVNGQLIQQVISSTTAASGSTSATVSADLKTKAKAFGFSFASWILSTSTITIVGSSTNPVFVVTNLSNAVTTQTVAGSVAVGDYNDVLAQGGTPVVGTTYDRYNFSITSNDVALGGASIVPVVTNGIIFVDKTTSATNATKFGIGWTNVTQGYTVNAGVAAAYTAVTGALDLTALKAALGITQGQNIFNQQTSA